MNDLVSRVAEGGRPIIFGEALYNIADDGSETMGGAPFVTAWNLAGLGMNPLFISRVGKDERGKAVLAAMANFGMDTSGIQIDSFLPTGTLPVGDTARKNMKALGIPEAQAFDAIEKDPAMEAARAANPAIFYHGTLMLRSRVSLTALAHLRRALDRPAYIDVNMRKPWISASMALEIMKNTAFIQLNKKDFELIMITCSFVGLDFLGMTGYLRDMSSADALVVTLGRSGAMLSTKLANMEIKQTAKPKVVDTEGCGEAFAAVMIAGMMKGWTLTQCVNKANEFAAAICAIKGETIGDREFYSSHAVKLGLK